MRSPHKMFAMLAAVLALHASGARAEPGLGEKVGKGVDNVAAKVARGVAVAVEKTGEALEKAGEKVQQFIKREPSETKEQKE